MSSHGTWVGKEERLCPGCGLAAVTGGGVEADLRGRPHPRYPRVVCSEQCTVQGNLTVVFRQQPSIYHRIGKRGG